MHGAEGFGETPVGVLLEYVAGPAVSIVSNQYAGYIHAETACILPLRTLQCFTNFAPCLKKEGTGKFPFGNRTLADLTVGNPPGEKYHSS